jgi:RNA polymerase sigma factor (TIGR02999 family)
LNRGADRAGAETADDILPLVYNELRRLAASRLAAENRAHTLQPTALVHEVWIRLGADRQPVWQNRAHFFGAAAEAMRRILIEAARRRQARRHGGGLARVDVADPDLEIPAPARDDELLAVHESLHRLAAEDGRKAELVKLRYFAGLTIEEAAEALGVSVPTAKRDWAYARAWLYQDIRDAGRAPSPTESASPGTNPDPRRIS